MKTTIQTGRFAEVCAGVLAAATTMLGTDSALADGLDRWHRRDAGASNYISALTYNPGGVFVAVDQNGPGDFSARPSALLTSKNGRTWERRQTGTNDLVTDRIAYGNGEYRAVRYSQYAFPGGEVLRSTNGVDWSVLNLDFFEEGLVVKSAEFVNGRWLMAGVPPGGGIIIECGDPFGPPCPEQPLRVFGIGSGWIDLEVPTFGSGGTLNLISADFAYGNGVWVVLAWLYRGEYFDAFGTKPVALFAWRSTDGTNFVRSPALLQSQANLLNAAEPLRCSVVHGNGRFVAAAHVAGIYSSADGFSWTTNFPTPAATLRDVAFGGGQFVAVGATGGFSSGAMVTSADGVNWRHRDPGTPEFLRQVEYGSHTFLVTGGSFGESQPKLVLQSDPVLSLELRQGTEPQFTLSAPVISSCRIEFTSDLSGTAPWQVWTNIEVRADPLVFPAPVFTEPRRFFRAVMDQ